MNYSILDVNSKLVPANYIKVALDAQKSNENAVKELLKTRKLPIEGWSDKQIEDLVSQLSSLDSNNFPNKVGLGEREGRIVCNLVAKRHYNFSHGIGRSGNLLESQPKAAGSTLLSNLTNDLCLDLLRKMGLNTCQSCFLVPMATGMALTLCFLSLKKQRPMAKYIIWSRIDQKSCLKSISAAGMKAVIIEPILNEEDFLETNLEEVGNKLMEIPLEEILCLFTTTSCFAPRNCDDIVKIAQLSSDCNIPHVVNNAYGLQTTYISHQLTQAQVSGRIDLFVQSTDKNLMVPVGGALIAGFDKEKVSDVAKCYPGRASSSQSLDVFMTLMSLGQLGYLRLTKQRKENFNYLKEKLNEFALKFNETVIPTKRNPISLALTLATLEKVSSTSITEFGSMLYIRGVSGVRVIAKGDIKTIDGHTFQNWGSHHSDTRISYLTVAAAIGIEKYEIDVFIGKLTKCWNDFLRNKSAETYLKQK